MDGPDASFSKVQASIAELPHAPVTIDLTGHIDGIRQEEYVSCIKAAQLSYGDEYCETLASRLQVRTLPMCL